MSEHRDADTKQVKVKSDEVLRQELGEEGYQIVREKGTERAFSGKYWNEKAPGVYRCSVCNNPLFSSETKYDSGSGWPSYWEPIDRDNVITESDKSHGMVRTEVLCSHCQAHLGHVFPDGPQPTGLRYCINSASLQLDETLAKE
tara:strand:+ start:673 stop:1104 length:432 start_codon:yes stop_codon:yes gene_type:complete